MKNKDLRNYILVNRTQFNQLTQQISQVKAALINVLEAVDCTTMACTELQDEEKNTAEKVT